MPSHPRLQRHARRSPAAELAAPPSRRVTSAARSPTHPESALRAARARPRAAPAMDDPAAAATLAKTGDNSDAAEASTSAAGAKQCNLRFLMVNGESFRLVLPAASTVHQVKQKVIDERPKGMY